MKMIRTTNINIVYVIITIFLLCACKQGSAKIKPAEKLIPIPSEVQQGEGFYSLNEQTQILLTDTGEALHKLGVYACNMLQVSTAGHLKVSNNKAEERTPVIYLSLDRSASSIGQEGYHLSIDSSGIKIVSQHAAGIFYGLQTLRQLLPDAIENSGKPLNECQLPFCEIKDSPRYAYRGSMLDVSRHFFSVEDVKRYIEIIAFYKMNTLHLGLSNDQGWRIEIKSWPDLTKIGGSSSVDDNKPGFYSQEQYKDIVQYAEDRFVTIVPEIDMPGHTNAALASYPVLNCNDRAVTLYTGIEVGFSSLCIHKDITYQFVNDVIRELSEITPGPYIHIGGDESHATKADDYVYFIEKASAIVTQYGKQVIGWDEVATAKLPANSLVQFWAKMENAKLANQQNAKLIMSPAKKVYLDMQYDSTTKLGLHWAAYVEIDSSYRWDPDTYIPGVSGEAIFGIEAPLWTETITNMDDIEYMVFPRLPGIAEIAWSKQKHRDWTSYRERLGAHANRMKALQIDYYESKQIPWK